LEGSFGNDDYPAATGRSLVNDCLDFFGLDEVAVVDNAIVGEPVSFSQRLDVCFLVLAEPVGNRGAVREQVLGSGLKAAEDEQHQREYAEELRVCHGNRFLLSTR